MTVKRRQRPPTPSRVPQGTRLLVYGRILRKTQTSGREEKSQSDKFKEAARVLGGDEDGVRSDERLREVAKQKPQPERP